MNDILEVKQATQLELFEPSEIVRPDVNIGKWAGWIFSSPWSKGLRDAKEHTWETEVDGSKVNASIKVRPIHGRKRPTTTTFRTFLALIQLWEFLGRPVDGKITFSSRQLAKVLKLKAFSASTATRIQEQLDILANTSITWAFSFNKAGKYEKRVSDMHMIEGVDYYEHGDFLNHEKFTKQQTVRLNPELVENMLNGKTKPINYEAYISITNDSSASLYTLLDIYLSRSLKWERRAKPLLFEDLEFGGKRYENRNIRLAKLKELKADLDGKTITTGTLVISIEKTSDGEDYKLVARKTPNPEKATHYLPRNANPKEDIPYIVDDLFEGISWVGSIPEKERKNLTRLAQVYSREMLFQVLAILKADYQGSVKTTPIKAFMHLCHVTAHQKGVNWIKPCGKSCPERPENRKNLFP
jgi:hypothetical protein